MCAGCWVRQMKAIRVELELRLTRRVWKVSEDGVPGDNWVAVWQWQWQWQEQCGTGQSVWRIPRLHRAKVRGWGRV
jgi:hypothetical protein